MISSLENNFSHSTNNSTTHNFPSPVAGEGKGEGEAANHPHLNPLPPKEGEEVIEHG
jgi:hypothetical protein